MATNNDVAVRKATLAALGATGLTQNERVYAKSLIDALAQANPSTKTEVVALVALTDSSGGTPSNTIVDVPGSYTEATLAAQISSLATKINQIIAALKA